MPSPDKETNNISLSLNVDEVNLLLKALGDRPFREVYELIGKINDQAYEQMSKEDIPPSEN